MYDYALEYELVDRNYAHTFDISDDVMDKVEQNKHSHIIFTENEIKILWENIEKVKFTDWIIIQIYMEWRPQELSILKLADVDLENWTITP